MTTSIYQRPTLSDLQSRIAADLSAVPDILREPLTKAFAAAYHGEHGHLDWIARQISPLTCDIEMLYSWGELYSVSRLLATPAEGDVTVTGNPAAEILIDTIARGQNDLDYRVTGAVTIASNGTAIARLRCDDVGASTNMVSGQTLTLIDPIPGIDDTLTVGASGLTGGSDDELIDDWRLRVVDEWRTVTTDGARSGRDRDYLFWSTSAHPSVTSALVYKHKLGLGTVLVMPVCNALPSRLPTQTVIAAVETALLSKAPATADVLVASPAAKPVNITLQLQNGFDTTLNRNAITAALYAAVASETSETSTLLMSEIDAAVATVTNQYVRHAPAYDVSVGFGEVLVLNEVVFI